MSLRCIVVKSIRCTLVGGCAELQQLKAHVGQDRISESLHEKRNVTYVKVVKNCLWGRGGGRASIEE